MIFALTPLSLPLKIVFLLEVAKEPKGKDSQTFLPILLLESKKNMDMLKYWRECDIKHEFDAKQICTNVTSQ